MRGPGPASGVAQCSTGRLGADVIFVVKVVVPLNCGGGRWHGNPCSVRWHAWRAAGTESRFYPRPAGFPHGAETLGDVPAECAGAIRRLRGLCGGGRSALAAPVSTRYKPRSPGTDRSRSPTFRKRNQPGARPRTPATIASQRQECAYCILNPKTIKNSPLSRPRERGESQYRADCMT